MGRAIDDDKPAEDLHELRKVGKELRYLLEFFASLYPAEVVKPMVKSLKGLQDMLGRFQDREVQANSLRELAPEVAEPRALMAMGVLVERFMQEEAAARAEFADRFGAFASKEQRAARQGALRVTRVLATYNIKGGVGKTSAAVNLATLAALGGARDAALGPRPAGREHVPVPRQAEGQGRRRASSCAARPTSTAAIKGTDHEGLDLLPADFSYRHMDLALGEEKRPTKRLASILAPLAGDYDYTFLDCPPSISLVSESVFEAADALLVPIIPATLSSRTLEQLHSVLGSEGGPQVLGFFSMADRRKRLHRELMDSLAREHDVLRDGDPDLGRGRADGLASRRARRLRAAQPRRAGLRGPLGRGPRTP